MCQIERFIKAFPKCELHVHIEGTLEAEQLRIFAARNGVLLPDLYSDELAMKEAYASFNNLQEFLDLYYQGIEVLRETADFRDLAEAYFAKAHRDNIKHAEIFFDPQAHTSRGVPLSTVCDGLLAARVPNGMTVHWIMCFLRDMPEESALEIFEDALPYFQSGQLLGIGLDSAEAPHPPSKFLRVYQKAKQAKVRCVAHAGEEGPPDFVWSALLDLGVERVDHGVRSVEDASLLNYLREHRIPLTVCPRSNVSLKVAARLEDLPLPALLDAGVVVTLNSDDPAYFGAYLADTMLSVQRAFSFDLQTWKKLARNAIEASFVDASRQTQLVEALKRVEENFQA